MKKYWLCLLLLTEALQAAARIQQECEGCHFEERSEPQGRFKNGLGQWADRNCVGCHQETNEIGENIFAGKTDARYYGLPLRREKLLKLHERPLSYTQAPKTPFLAQKNVARMDRAGLLNYLRHPVRSPYFNGPELSMMAFPETDADTLADLLKNKAADFPKDPETPVKDFSKGRKLWETVCQSCHAAAGATAAPSGFYLSHLSPGWIAGYAQGSFKNPYKERTMPTFAVDESEAASLVQYLRQEKQQTIDRLDQDVRVLQESAQRPQKQLELQPLAITWLLEKMPRAALCVHCHDGEQRAASRFRATRAGIIDYVGKHGRAEILARLKTRSLEVKAGVTASRPGMPMTLAPLPDQVIQMMETWLSQSCPLEDGRKICVPD